MENSCTQTKTAFITGASGAIGSAISLALAREGYSLALLGGNNEKRLYDTAEQCRKCSNVLYAAPVDFRDRECIRRVIGEAARHLGQIHLLVNSAGISHIGLLTDMTDEEWTSILDINLSSVFYCCRFVIPYMVHQKNGHIINISSVWGNTGASTEAAYSATKGGMDAITKALAKELAPCDIAVNAIACGMIDTRMNHCFSEEEIQAICDEIPMGRMGTPEEVAETVLAITKMPVYLTGNIFKLDGGWQ